MVNSYPERKYRELRLRRLKRVFLFFLLGFMMTLVSFFVCDKIAVSKRLGLLLPITISVLFSIIAIALSKPSVEEQKYRVGVQGEKEFRKILNRESGVKFYNVPLNHGDVDALLVCRRGIFAFEVKRYSGIVICRDEEWYRHRSMEHVKSPAEEAKRHAAELSRLLRGCVNFEIIPVVVLVGAREVIVDNCEMEITSAHNTHGLIKKYREIMSNREVKRIARCVKEQMFRKY